VYWKLGSDWTHVRKILQKDLFSPSTAETYLPLLDQPVRLISKQLPKVERIDSITPHASTDMFFSIILGFNPKTVLGINENKENLVDPKDLEFVKNAMNTLTLTTQLISDPTNSPSKPGPKYEELKQTLKNTGERALHYIERAKMTLLNLEKNTGLPLPYMTRLLQRNELSDEDLNTELVFLVFAGVDTTHHLLLWNILNLAKYTDKQEILRKEILSVVGEDGPLEPKHLKSLPYLTQCIRETHRLTSTSWHLTRRRLSEDSAVGGYSIPKNTILTLCLMQIQYDPKYVDDADKFIPERWRPEEVAKRKGTPKEILDHPLLAKPFGYGQRMCIGARVAELEIKALIIRLLQDYTFEWNPPEQTYQLALGVMLRASPFPIISFKPRKK